MLPLTGKTLLLKIKSALSGLRQFLATESPLKMMKNAFYFTSKVLFVLKIFKFLPWLFGDVSKRFDWKDKVNFKFFDVTAWFTNNRNTNIAQYHQKLRQSNNETWSVKRISHKKYFSWKIIHKMWGRSYSQTLFWKIKIEHISGSMF